LKCECNFVQGYWLNKNSNTCFNCSSVSNTQLPGTRTGCGCKPFFFWNSSTLSCECDLANGAYLGSLGCGGCPDIMGSNGISNGNSCQCIVGWVWNTIQSKCVCDVNQGFTMVNGYCYDCFTVPGSNGVPVPNGCGCLNGNQFSLPFLSTPSCSVSCPSNIGLYFYNSLCRACSNSILPTATTQAQC